MSPQRTTALPFACVRLPALQVGARGCEGRRPEGRRGPEGEVRWAVRKGRGASLAKVRAGKVRGWGGVGRVIGAVGRVGLVWEGVCGDVCDIWVLGWKYFVIDKEVIGLRD